MASPFDILLIEPGADRREIDRAYRDRVLETHPDQGGSTPEFRRVKAAYEELTTGGTDGVDDPGVGHRVGETSYPPSRIEYLDYEALDDNGWGLKDDDLFEKAAAAGLDPSDHGRFLVKPHEYLLEAAENRGFRWPYACRGGACANCAIYVRDGDLSMPVDHILPSEMMREGIRLSCNGAPVTDEMQVVFNLKHRPDLRDLRLPPHRFERDQVSR